MQYLSTEDRALIHERVDQLSRHAYAVVWPARDPGDFVVDALFLCEYDAQNYIDDVLSPWAPEAFIVPLKAWHLDSYDPAGFVDFVRECGERVRV